MSRKGNTDHYYSDDNYGTRNSNLASVSDKSTDSSHGYENTTRDDKQVRSAPSSIPKGTKDNPATGQTDEMMVLGAMHKGAKTFESIQKKTGLGDDLLNSALENLEGSKQIRIIQKKGLFGVKIEIYPTDKGFREYYS